MKKTFDLNTLPELKAAGTNEGEFRETEKEASAPAIPIERGPQINR